MRIEGDREKERETERAPERQGEQERRQRRRRRKWMRRRNLELSANFLGHSINRSYMLTLPLINCNAQLIYSIANHN